MLTFLSLPTASLIIIEQTLHARHRPPPGRPHVEMPERLTSASAALRAAPFSGSLEWRRACDSPVSLQGAIDALKLVHDVEHLRNLQAMSKTGG